MNLRAVPCVICLWAISSFAAQAKPQSEGNRRSAIAYAIKTPRPDYPIEAMRLGVEGSGLYVLHLEQRTGKVTAVEVKKSAGHSSLDKAAVNAFRHWQFTQGSPFSSVEIPLNFTMRNQAEEQLAGARRYATYSPLPIYPTQARFSYVLGWGLFEFLIDYNTGKVQDVKVVQTSGSGAIDDSIVHTFRTWKFRPHTVRSLVTRYGFMFGRGGLGNNGGR